MCYVFVRIIVLMISRPNSNMGHVGQGHLAKLNGTLVSKSISLPDLKMSNFDWLCGKHNQGTDPGPTCCLIAFPPRQLFWFWLNLVGDPFSFHVKLWLLRYQKEGNNKTLNIFLSKSQPICDVYSKGPYHETNRALDKERFACSKSLFYPLTVCCGYSKESSQDDSFEYP